MGPIIDSHSGADKCFSVDSQVAHGSSEDSSRNQWLLAFKSVLG